VSLSDIPGRVFLDTSVVNFVLDYGEQIHDGRTMPPSVSDRVLEDIESLRGIFVTGQRAAWQFAISPFTYKEVISTNDRSRRHNLESWFFEIWNHWREVVEQDNGLPDFLEAETVRLELLSSEILRVLPDVEDRILICDAVAYRCDCFCTRDWRSILLHRDLLSALPIKIVTPTEWWRLIRPYASLWA
jgi:hypothetical protein